MNWLVMRSKSNKEAALEQELWLRGFEVYSPEIRVKPINPRSRKLRPFLPGYVFVKADLEHVGFSDLNWVPFSQGLVSFGGMTSEVADVLVQQIRRQVELINAVGGEQLLGLKPGERVAIIYGPFEGYEAIFDLSLPGQERVRLLLEMASRRQVSVTVPSGYIRKI